MWVKIFLGEVEKFLTEGCQKYFKRDRRMSYWDKQFSEEGSIFFWDILESRIFRSWKLKSYSINRKII